MCITEIKFVDFWLKVSALSSTNDVIENFINTSIKANFPVYEDYLSTSEGGRQFDVSFKNLFSETKL